MTAFFVYSTESCRMHAKFILLFVLAQKHIQKMQQYNLHLSMMLLAIKINAGNEKQNNWPINLTQAFPGIFVLLSCT